MSKQRAIERHSTKYLADNLQKSYGPDVKEELGNCSGLNESKVIVIGHNVWL